MDMPLPRSRVELWLDATDDSTITTDDGHVTSWASRVGSVVFYGAQHHRPERVPDGVRFWHDAEPGHNPGESNSRYLSATANLFSIYPAEVFVVADQVTLQDSRHGVFFAAATTASSYIWVSDKQVVSRRTKYQGTSHQADWSDGARNIISARFDHDYRYAWVNDGAQIQSAYSDQETPGSELYLGLERTSFETNSLIGTIREVIVIPGCAELERLALVGYLAAKWGLPVENFPMIRANVQSVQRGGDVTIGLFDWQHPAAAIRVRPEYGGDWSAYVESGREFGVYYLSSDPKNPPICHGPYTVE